MTTSEPESMSSGGSANETPENINWSKERFGCWYYIDFDEINVEGEEALTDSLDHG